ncbi:hypothetical protein [Bradyrhizobium sp. NAS96.2]|uniref:hypothetical protein n=1 Tax=Bradyrhizobium sp. NAS96.2 TaxID=1680160 RepID=UPI00093F8185|nr:hypothetical protein [Bradyrhizobium sp. NAS96.2]
MKPIDPIQYPLFNRMVVGLFQGVGRSFSSEDQLPAFLLEFFHESEIERLLTELQQIASKNLSDREWEKFWYRGPAYSFPKNAESSNRLVRLVVKEILDRRTRKAG